MSQNWNDVASSDSISTAILTKLEEKLAALRTVFSGSSAPADTAAYMLWVDTSNKVIKQRNSADTGWQELLSLGVENNKFSSTVRIGSLSSGDYYLVAPNHSITVEEIFLITATTVAASTTDYYTFQVANLTQSNDLLSTAQDTQSVGITADTVYKITPDQNEEIAADDVIELQVSVTGSPIVMTDAIVILHGKSTGA